MAAFLKKNWQKDAGDIAINAGIRGAGAAFSAFALNKWFNGEPADGAAKTANSTNTAKTLQNIMGPIFLGIGVLGDMMLADEKLRSFAQGWTTYSLLHSIAVIAPNTAAPLGLAETKPVTVSGLGKTPMLLGMGNAPAQQPKALGETTEAYTGNYPEELLMAQGQKIVTDTDGKTYNNDWKYIAENIDNADKFTQTVKTINGVDDENAAALMGVATEEEAALLMGMF